MAVDLNMDMGDLIKSLMSKKEGGAAAAGAPANSGSFADKIAPFKNAIIFFVVTGAICGCYIGLYYIPMKQENLKKQTEIARLMDLKDKTKMLENKIANIQNKLSKSKEQYIESLSHFGNSEDLGALYRSVSTLAAKYDLDVMHIKEVTPPPVAPAPKKPGQEAVAAPKKAQIEVKEIMVEVELKGHYAQYVRFKEDLSIAEILLKVNQENIKVNSDKVDAGKIYVKLNLSTYAIDKSKFNSVVSSDQENEGE